MAERCPAGCKRRVGRALGIRRSASSDHSNTSTTGRSANPIKGILYLPRLPAVANRARDHDTSEATSGLNASPRWFSLRQESNKRIRGQLLVLPATARVLKSSALDALRAIQDDCFRRSIPFQKMIETKVGALGMRQPHIPFLLFWTSRADRLSKSPDDEGSGLLPEVRQKNARALKLRRSFPSLEIFPDHAT